MMKIKYIFKRTFIALCALLLTFSSLQIPNVKAATYKPEKLGVITDAGARLRVTPPSGIWTEAYWIDGIDKISVNGETAFCIEPMTIGTGGTYSKYDDIPINLQTALSLIVYYGWDTSAKTNDDYATTQYMVWEYVGAEIKQWYGNFGSRYMSKKAAIQSKINNHYKKPSLPSGPYNVKVGETLTLSDSNGVLNEFKIKDDGGANASIIGNTLVIKPDINTPASVNIKLQKVLDKYTGNSIAYRSSADDGQDVAIFKVSDPLSSNITINVEKEGSLKIAKQDTNGTLIPNTSFKVSYNSNMSSPIGTYKTGADGTVTVNGLLPQSVYIQETSVPSPLILDSTVRNVTIVPNDTVTYTATNSIQQGQITIAKQDSETGVTAQGDATLNGAEYDVYDSTKSNIVDHLVYGSKNTTITLPLGTYYLKESKAPTGYLLDDKFIEIKIEYAGQTVSSAMKNVTLYDDVIKGKIAINKTVDHIVKSNSATVTAGITASKGVLIPGKGFTFEIVHDSTGKVVDTITTDVDGYAISKELPYGNYTIKEKETEGYSRVDPIKVSITEDGKTYHYNILNEAKKTVLNIIKKDADTGETIPVAGVGFKLQKEDGTYLIQTEAKYDTFYTDKNGEITLPEKLLYGETYTIREVSGTVPEKYLLSLEGKKITITGESTMTVEMYNKAVKGEIDVNKIGEVLTGITKDGDGNITFNYENKPLAGAQFEITATEDIKAEDLVSADYYKAGELVATVTTGADGTAKVGGLPLGKYTITEIVAPNGMVLNKDPKQVELKYAGESTAVVFDSVKFENDRVKINVNASKKDADTNELIAGAQFTLYAGEDIKAFDGAVLVTEGSKIETVTTGNDGTTAIKADLPLSTYRLIESKAPLGYASTDTEYSINGTYVDQNTPMLSFTYQFVNEPTVVSISKQDITTQVETAGNILQVFDEEGNKVDEWTSVQGEEHIIKYLHVGEEYTLVEYLAKDGYLKANDVKFMIADTGDVQSVVMKDDRVYGHINIYKSGEILDDITTDADGNISFIYKEKPLANAVFEIYAKEDIKHPDGVSADFYKANTLVETLTTGVDGIATSKALPLGNYYVKELTAPNGMTNNSAIKDISLTYKDQYTSLVYDEVEYVNERQKVEISVKKQDSETMTFLEGAEFTLYTKDVIKAYDGTVLLDADSSIETVTTDENGVAEFIADLPLSNYYVKESKSPIGYASTDKVVDIDATYKGQDITIISNEAGFMNDITKVEFSKIDITTGNELPGAMLKVYPKDDPGSTFDTWVSGDTPHIIKGLEPNVTYVLEETSSPYGFAIAEKIEFTVMDTGIVQKVKMDDELVLGQLAWNKTGMIFTQTVSGATNAGIIESPVWEESNILGAEITIYADEDIVLGNGITYYEKDDVVEVLESDWDVVYSSELPVGKYYYVETKTPLGYVSNTEKHYFEIVDNQKDELQIVESTLKNDRPSYKFIFTKLLEENPVTGCEEAYKDVVFGIFTRDDTYDYMGKVAIEPDTLVATVGINEFGGLVDMPVLPIGNYYIKELATNNAYILDSETEYDFMISQSHEEEVIVVINEDEPVLNELKDFTVKVNKVDAQFGLPILSPDFIFKAYADEECTQEIYTENAVDDNGYAIFDELHYGTWYIKEVQAPDGYRLSDEVVKVVINYDGVYVNDELVKQGEEGMYSFEYQNSLLPVVNSGDHSYMMMYLSMSLFSLISIIGIIILRLKKR